MANNTEKKINPKDSFESRPDLKNLVFYTVIVNRGQSDGIIKIFKNTKSSFQLIQFGEGTSKNQFKTILGAEETDKDILYSIVREDIVPDIKREIDAFFATSKRNIGIAYTISLKSLVGVKMYKYLTQTVRG